MLSWPYEIHLRTRLTKIPEEKFQAFVDGINDLPGVSAQDKKNLLCELNESKSRVGAIDRYIKMRIQHSVSLLSINAPQFVIAEYLLQVFSPTDATMLRRLAHVDVAQRLLRRNGKSESEFKPLKLVIPQEKKDMSEEAFLRACFDLRHQTIDTNLKDVIESNFKQHFFKRILNYSAEAIMVATFNEVKNAVHEKGKTHTQTLKDIQTLRKYFTTCFQLSPEVLELIEVDAGTACWVADNDPVVQQLRCFHRAYEREKLSKNFETLIESLWEDLPLVQMELRHFLDYLKNKEKN